MAEILNEILPEEMCLEIESFLDWRPLYEKTMKEFDERFGKGIRDWEHKNYEPSKIWMGLKCPNLIKVDNDIYNEEDFDEVVRGECKRNSTTLDVYIRQSQRRKAHLSKKRKLEGGIYWREVTWDVDEDNDYF